MEIRKAVYASHARRKCVVDTASIRQVARKGVFAAAAIVLADEAVPVRLDVNVN
jgi:hypothetical protein